MKIGDLVKYYDKLYVVVSDAILRPGACAKIQVKSMQPHWPGGWIPADDPNLEVLSKK